MPAGLMASSLMRNGYALIANSGLTAVLGLVFWLLAAHLCSQEAVGLGGAITATIVNLSNAAQLNFGNLLVRFVPTIGSRAGKLILFAYGVSVVSSVIVAGVFLLVVGAFMPKLEVLTHSVGIVAWFVATVALWSVFALQDSALSGLRQSIWVPVSKTTYQIVKVAMLVPLALFGFGWGAIALAWTAPVIVFIVAVNLLIFKRLIPKGDHRPVHERLIHRRAMVRFFGWDYIGSVSMMAAWTATPLVVLNLIGAAESASFFVAWTIFTSLYYFGDSMGLSLLAEGASDTGRLRSLAADAAVMSMLPLLGLVAVILVFAHPIMAVFGASYADEGASILRILAIASVVSAVLSIYLSIARTKGWMRSVAAAEVALMVLTLAAGVFLVRSQGAIGMALAWLLAMTVVTCGVGVFALLTNRRHSGYDWVLALASSSRRLVSHFVPLGLHHEAALPADADIAPILAAAAGPDARGWKAYAAEPGPEGMVTVLLGEPHADGHAGYEPRAVLHRAGDLVAIGYLERHIDNLDQLSADARLKRFSPLLPSRLAVCRRKGVADCMEAVARGEDGAGVLRRSAQAQSGLAATVRAISTLHGRTAALRTIDEAWIQEWVEQPVAQLRLLRSSLMSRTKRAQALDLFVDRQRSYWLGREQCLGWCHGDLQPRNLRFTKTRGNAVTLSGILEWGNARPDAPGGYDACSLAIALRMIASGEPLGAVVADLVWLPEWHADERAWFAKGTRDEQRWSGDIASIRAMVGLAWLHQVSGRIGHPEGTGRLWTASNVDRVLHATSANGGAL